MVRKGNERVSAEREISKEVTEREGGTGGRKKEEEAQARQDTDNKE
jgi:hypothetical protein